MDCIALLRRSLTQTIVTGVLDRHPVCSAANCIVIFSDFHVIKTVKRLPKLALQHVPKLGEIEVLTLRY